MKLAYETRSLCVRGKARGLCLVENVLTRRRRCGNGQILSSTLESKCEGRLFF
jgi:hypothetical protein